jgi:hypothetical protein
MTGLQEAIKGRSAFIQFVSPTKGLSQQRVFLSQQRVFLNKKSFYLNKGSFSTKSLEESLLFGTKINEFEGKENRVDIDNSQVLFYLLIPTG